MTQLTLPGFDVPPPAPEHRIFFAAMPDPATAARIAGMAESLQSGKGGVLRTERLHVTLCSLGDFAYVPDATIARARAAAERIDARSFGVTFDQLLSFNGRLGHRPLVLAGQAGLEALIDFQQRLRDAFGKAGLRVSRARFTPHVTLLYGERRPDQYKIDPITWTVREFVLIHSWLGRTHYDVIGRWPLTIGSTSA
ncbi:2'-5' RNA ligase [Burkholderia stabilis]|uniref:2'-5' RNA ligase family protein n=1 Tax=Burkholderia stabilis TaxID=95485 RepID=UPI0008521788|nr:2'-5' RNA ligase family protein [Burkholderia stabilis]AOR66422.1 2'-5' RNA ligase [Burkholderia stabilis]HDR9490534.1 2'-5' RNA ligase family protein [Burkholderia stabilis]HDR9522486.1 2'-5' RNA ligase family protein [Burkholderia stabilis]HDR9530117.1 2'-5' RNA ligase family protein [Burkholderia stabilis]HDR9537639.1 2'-5' RNA ligase family protein [Burkholderia stabilis]